MAASFRTLNGLAAGTALLVVMGALKLLEARSRRDDAIVVAVALFLLLAAALAGQALWRAPLYLLVVVRRLRRLRAHRASRQRADRARRVAALGARAGHVDSAGAGLFHVLPAHLRAVLDAAARRHGDHRALGRDVTGQHRQARHRIRSRLSRAFRRRSRRARAALYWRGPVLNSFDGFTWRRAGPWVYRAAPLDMLGEPVRYRVTLEPTNQRWMFALDTVATQPASRRVPVA